MCQRQYCHQHLYFPPDSYLQQNHHPHMEVRSTQISDSCCSGHQQTTIKMFVGHDTPAAAFNSLEFSQKADKLEGEVRVCIIQASKVVEAGYFLSWNKTMKDLHLSDHYNNHPRLLRMDAQVKTHNIPNPTRSPWSAKNQVHAAHIICSAKKRERRQHSNG